MLMPIIRALKSSESSLMEHENVDQKLEIKLFAE